MKFVRIDALRTPELHPRLTLLRGILPEQRRLLEGLLGAISDRSPFEPAGKIEVNGVLLDLDGDTIERLRLDEGLEWILDWGTAADQTRPATVTASAPASETVTFPSSATAPAAVRASAEVRAASPFAAASTGTGTGTGTADGGLVELESLRENLRTTAAERTRLAGEMDQVRVRLDSFANAALEVCVGQIDALEVKRGALRRQFEANKSVVDQQLVDMESTYQGHVAEIEAVESLDLTDVRAKRDGLSLQLAQNRGPDPRSLELALRIDATMRRVRDLRGQVAAVSLRRREAGQRLAESVAELEASERALRQRTFDPAIVARLEQVRDELFADDDKPSRLSVNRNRRRMLSLREEESKLLAQLGFDTYSSYVMGIPSMRAEVERSARVDQARARVDEIQREIDALDEPAEALLVAAEADLNELLATAATLLGDNPGLRSHVVSTTEPTADPAGDGVADEVARVVELLRSTQLDVGVDGQPAVMDAADELRRSINGLAQGRFAQPAGAKPPRLAGSSVDPVAWSGPPSALLDAVDVWLKLIGDTSEWRRSAGDAVEQLRSQIDELAGSSGTPTEVSEWAEVEAELDTLLDKLVGAQERVRRNEEALVELAAQRERELAIRARERDLLAQIARVEQDLRSKSGIAADQAGPVPAGPETAATPVPEVSSPVPSPAEGLAGSPDPEWTFVQFAARRRSVSFAGSLPIVVFNMSGSGADGTGQRDEVFDRVVRLSELIQVLLFDESAWAAERVAALGMDARTVELR